MRLMPTPDAKVKIMALTALQAVFDGNIKAEYAGTIRKYDAVVTRPYLEKCLGVFFSMAAAIHPEMVVEVNDDKDSIQETIDEMMNTGYLQYIVHRDVYVLSGLYLNTYYLGTQANIQDFGAVVWGKLGLGATYQGFDQPPLPFDQGVTAEQFLAQFPKHKVSGNDVVLVMAGADALDLLVHGWEPRLKTLVEEYRTFIPTPDPLL